MSTLLSMLIGATVGMFVIVRVFCWLAGVSFSSWRQVLVAYLVAGIAGTFIYAFGSPEFAPLQFVGAIIAAGFELLMLRRAPNKPP